MQPSKKEKQILKGTEVPEISWPETGLDSHHVKIYRKIHLESPLLPLPPK